MKVKLVYPAFYCSRPHTAEATVECHLTPRQIVVERQNNPNIIHLDGPASGASGIGACRFWRRHGGRVGGESRMRSWRLAPGELKRLNDEAAREATL